MRLRDLNVRTGDTGERFLERHPAIAGLDPELYETLVGDNAHHWGDLLGRFGDLDLSTWCAVSLTPDEVLRLGTLPHPLLRTNALDEHQERAYAVLTNGVDPLPHSPRFFSPGLLATIRANGTWPTPIVVTVRDGTTLVVEGHHRVGYLRAVARLGVRVTTAHRAFQLSPARV